MKWQELVSLLPEDAGARAARARRRALARREPEARTQEPEGRWWPVAVAVTSVLVAAIVWFRQAWQVETLAWQPPAPVIAPAALEPLPVPRPARAPVPRRAPQPERLQVQLVLSDGMRVYWTFDKNFSLGGKS
jgi:hypothetical protein